MSDEMTTIRTGIPEPVFRKLYESDLKNPLIDESIAAMGHDPSYPQPKPRREYVREMTLEEVAAIEERGWPFNLSPDAINIIPVWPEGCYPEQHEPTRWERIRSWFYWRKHAVRHYFSNLWDAICGRGENYG